MGVVLEYNVRRPFSIVLKDSVLRFHLGGLYSHEIILFVKSHPVKPDEEFGEIPLMAFVFQVFRLREFPPGLMK